MPMTRGCLAKTWQMHPRYYSSGISEGKEREAPEDFVQDQNEASLHPGQDVKRHPAAGRRYKSPREELQLMHKGSLSESKVSVYP